MVYLLARLLQVFRHAIFAGCILFAVSELLLAFAEEVQQPAHLTLALAGLLYRVVVRVVVVGLGELACLCNQRVLLLGLNLGSRLLHYVSRVLKSFHREIFQILQELGRMLLVFLEYCLVE